MPLIDPGLDDVLQDHEKRIRDLERRPMGCLEFHDHFYVVCPTLHDLPGPERYGGQGVGYLALETGFVWAWTGIPDFGGVWDDGGGRTLEDWLPDPV